MAIISVTPGQVGLVGVLPSIAYIQTTDTVATITTTGYLNKEVASGVQFSLPCIACVSTKATPTSIPAVGWYEVQHVGSDWSLDAGSNTAIGLTNGHIFVGNASNVAADVAMTGDITITNAGVTAIGAGVIVNADINAAAAIAYSKLAALPSAQILVGSAGNVATAVAMTGDVTITNAGVTAIGTGVIVNADISASAAIDFSKLATLASTNILVGSAGGVATSVTMTGDVTISNTGVTAIATGIIVNADISASAAIDFSKLAALTSGNIIVGSAGTVPTSVAMSGDATLIASGALTIANDAITTVKILNANVTLAKLAAGITPSAVIKFNSQVTTAGGAAAEAFTVTGALAASDRAFVQIVDNGSSDVTVLQAVVTNDTLTVTFSANPGNDTVINYLIIRAAS